MTSHTKCDVSAPSPVFPEDSPCTNSTHCQPFQPPALSSWPWPLRRPSVSAPAQARERQANISGSNGNSATRNVQRAGGDVSSSSTGVHGKTRSRNVDRSAEGTQATVVGPNGKAATRSSSALGQGDSTTTLTGPDGQTATRAAKPFR
jgi:hypothetical protein